MSTLLPDFLPSLGQCSCGVKEWKWERWGKILGKSTEFRHFTHCHIVCKGCRRKGKLTLDRSISASPIFLYPEDAPAIQQPNWVQDHFEMEVPLTLLMENITWIPENRKPSDIE
jgi:hypothetical protein